MMIWAEGPVICVLYDSMGTEIFHTLPHLAVGL